MGKGWRWAVVMLSLLGPLALGGAADPLLDPLRDLLVQAVAKAISRSLQGRLEVGALRGSLLSAPTLENVVLRDAQNHIVARIARLHLSYDLKTLLKGYLRVHRLEVVQPWLRLEEGADGRLNLLRIFSAPSPPPAPSPSPAAEGGDLPFAVAVERLVLRDGALEVRLPALPGVDRVEGLQAQLRLRLAAQGLQVRFEQLTATALPADVTLRALRGVVRLLAEGTQLEALHLETDHSRLALTGVLPGGRQPASLQVAAQPLAVSELGQLLGQAALQGEVQLRLALTGPPSALQLAAALHSAEGRVVLHGEVDTTAAPPRYHGTLEVAHLDLGTLLRRAGWQSDLNVQVDLQGTGTTLPPLRGRAQVRVLPSRLGDLVLSPSRLDLEVAERRFAVHHFSLITSGAQLQAAGVIDLEGTSHVDYRLHADLAQLRALLPELSPAGRLELQGEASGEGRAVRTQGTLQASGLRVGDYAAQQLRLTYAGEDLAAQPRLHAEVVAEQGAVAALSLRRLEAQATYEAATRQGTFAVELTQAPGRGGGSARHLGSGRARPGTHPDGAARAARGPHLASGGAAAPCPGPGPLPALPAAPGACRRSAGGGRHPCRPAPGGGAAACDASRPGALAPPAGFAGPARGPPQPGVAACRAAGCPGLTCQPDAGARVACTGAPRGHAGSTKKPGCVATWCCLRRDARRWRCTWRCPLTWPCSRCPWKRGCRRAP
ncbi:MAG: hypothetical protein KatS3mg131_1477 [Candidatus Tectimicrobiota bacterium]|nr:MAG: hypothetical protein KatS3mg131_1477 [Candidatus Tectomicrobia bacterium]